MIDLRPKELKLPIASVPKGITKQAQNVYVVIILVIIVKMIKLTLVFLVKIALEGSMTSWQLMQV